MIVMMMIGVEKLFKNEFMNLEFNRFLWGDTVCREDFTQTVCPPLSEEVKVEEVS